MKRTSGERGGKSDKWATAVCEACGKEFRFYPLRSRGRFCSQACRKTKASQLTVEAHARNPGAWQTISDAELLEAWQEFKAGKFAAVIDLGRFCCQRHGFDFVQSKIYPRLRKLVGAQEYENVKKAAAERGKYPEEMVRQWFDKWLSSHRPLHDLHEPGMPHFHTVGKLFRKYFYLEYEDAIERKQGKAYQIGRAFEYRCRDFLRSKGFVVFRSPQSRSAADLVALRQGLIILVQCKTRRDSLGKQERAELIEMASQAGGVPMMAWRGRKRTGITWERLDDATQSIEF